jgi:hypothetical protein
VSDPLVSFVIIGRNDDYMGDYQYRLATSLSFLAESAGRAQLLEQLEVLVVDWASERPLATELPLTPEARRITTFLHVRPEILQARYGATRWIPTCAVNVGVRRAHGRFIFFTDSDCLWSEHACASLGRLLRGEIDLPAPIDEVLCYVRRYQVPWATVHRRPHLDEWRRVAALIVATAVPEYPSASCLGGFSGGQLMHRSLWHAAKGYDEQLDRPWGWSDNDLMLRVSQEHTWLDVSGYGFFGLHMEHWPQSEARFRRDPATVNPMTIRNEPAANDLSWGLGDFDIPPTQCSSPASSRRGPGCAVALSGKTANPLARDWRPEPAGAEFVRRVGADREQPAVAFDQLAAVAQIVLADLPRTIYWFGSVSPAVLLTMLKACPGAELFLVNPWPGGISDGIACNPGALSGFIEANCAFRGWARIVQGNPLTALERIDRSSTGRAPIELAWVAGDAPLGVIGDITDRLAPGGVALLPVGSSSISAEDIQGAARDCVTQALGSTGLIAITRRLDPEAHRPGSDSVDREQLVCS